MTTSSLLSCKVLLVLFVIVFGAEFAHADKTEALKHYKRGTTAYNLGKFDKAITHFEAAYEEHPDVVFLFNIAQCYRQLDNCERATFFYKRYLSLKPDATNRDEVNARIAELQKRCEEKQDLPKRPPEGTAPPGGKGGDTPPVDKPPVDKPPVDKPPVDKPPVDKPPVDTPPADTPPADTTTRVSSVDSAPGSGDSSAVVGGGAASITTNAPVEQSSFASTADFGLSFIDMGELEVPSKFSVRLGLGYVMDLGSVELQAGAMVNLTPLQYDYEEQGTALLASILGNVTLSYAVSDSLRVRGELGAGVLVFSGLSEGNPFTEEAAGTTGALSAFNVRWALGLDYALSDSLVASLSPLCFSYSPPIAGLIEEIDKIQRIDVLFGVGYRF